MMLPYSLEDLLTRVDNLPGVPSVALQVNRMLDVSDIETQELAAVIVQDPGLMTQILKICNSAEYGFSRQIATLSEAVSILGFQELRRVLMTIISHGLLNRPVSGYALEKGALWENAVTCGAYARHIAVSVNYPDPELACVAALLRDIGKIAVEHTLTDLGRDIEALIQAERISFEQAEERILGASHATVGTGLAQKWNLPESLADVIAYHHHPSMMPETVPESVRQLVCIVHLADVFAMLSGGAGLGSDGLMYPAEAEALTLLGIEADRRVLDSLYAELLNLRGQIESMSAALK